MEASRKTLKDKLEMYTVTSSACLALLLLTGHLLRRRSRWLRALRLPSSVLGGLVGWLTFAAVELAGGEQIADDWFSVGWDVLPSYCTNIVFSCLFLGCPVPPAATVLRSPVVDQLIYGLIVVFGQYATSSAFTCVVRWFDPSFPPAFATIMPYGYAGGPVVAEAMLPLYAPSSFNYPDGYTLALLAATVGMFVGVIAGALLVNLAPLAANHAPPLAVGDAAARDDASEQSDLQLAGRSPNGGPVPRRRGARRLAAAIRRLGESAPDSDHYPPGARPPAAEQTVSAESLDSFMFHLCLVAAVMAAGYLLRLPFVLIEETFPPDSFFARANLLSVLPLFLFCLVAGLAVQKAVDTWWSTAPPSPSLAPLNGSAESRAEPQSFIDRETILRISNTAQDILIVSAIARLGRNGLPPGVYGLGHFFTTVFTTGVPFLLVCAAGLIWGVVAFWYVAPRLLPDFWAERALVEFGVSIGATSTGLLLLRMADPDGKTPVLRDFTFKQIFHVLITGGGFFDVFFDHFQRESLMDGP